MPTLETINHDVHFTMLKGEPGTRKSTQALSWPKPQYWASHDRKMNALSLPLAKWKIDPKLIEYDDYKDWNTCEAKLKKLQLNCPYRTVVIDSITSITDNMLLQVKDSKGGQTRKSGAVAGKMIGGIEVNELEDFNAEAAAITDMISILKDIKEFHKVNIILIAHVIRADYKSVKDGTVISRSIVTAGAKKQAAKIPAYCEEIYHFGLGQGSGIVVGSDEKIVALTRSNGDDFARTTLPLPSVIEIGYEPMYEKHIVPAIAKLKAGLV